MRAECLYSEFLRRRLAQTEAVLDRVRDAHAGPPVAVGVHGVGHPVIGGGTDSAIYEAAGKEQLFEKRKEIGEIVPGDVAYTPGFDLGAKYIFHTVGPSWIDGEHNERDILRTCYKKSLELAASLEVKSIAFPLIATGVYGFPKDEALSIALSEIQTFLLSHDEMKIILVVFDRKSFVLSEERFGGLEAYIDEHYVGEQIKREYSPSRRKTDEEILEERSLRASYFEAEEEADMMLSSIEGISLDEMLDIEDMTFQQKLLFLIDEIGRASCRERV